MKWALRHLKLESGCFGEVDGENQWRWYQRFAQTEKESNYAPDVFSKSLLPALPPDHADLLRAVLDLTSSVASHADSNAMSGSKLSKVLGWWLLSTRDVPSDHSEWTKFYAEWETSARVLEHLFFAFLRWVVEHRVFARPNNIYSGILARPPRSPRGSRNSSASILSRTWRRPRTDTYSPNRASPLDPIPPSSSS